MSEPTERKQIPIEEGVFAMPASPEEKPYLIGARCEACGTVTFPKRTVCPRCVKPGTMQEHRLAGRGRLNTFSIVNAALPGFQAPSIQAYVDLAEGPRIWSLITGVDPDAKLLQIGMDLELVVGKVREDESGNDLMSYQFRPTRQ
ncbi:MAG: Zn-ribbon domain-containing OB-fold protein [Deltaproteobacteria bacterium]|nr:Zn-ribbon domain-containing OB-fold protein [Deltaproteobacteria bacterium]